MWVGELQSSEELKMKGDLKIEHCFVRGENIPKKSKGVVVQLQMFSCSF